jgi:superfamily II DNA/RNA helicase
MTTSFAQLGLPDALVRALSKRGITEPFPVQIATIPDALAGRDVSGKAPTGSGKTLAFGLPLLSMVDRGSRNKPKSLLLAPTRELAEQIKQELQPLASTVGRTIAAIYGGVGYGPQIKALRGGVDILVATPGRLEDLMEQRAVDLHDVNIVVVDEADRMADMGFMPAVRRILDKTSRQRQTLLFSATLDGAIAVLSRDYQKNPVSHEAESIEPDTTDARHHFWLVAHDDRVQHTADIVTRTGRSIVFTRTRRGADRLTKHLTSLGVNAVPMHGGRSQAQRQRALQAFSSGRAQALVATDVAARGIHVDSVESVIHFDPPTDHKDYLHRSGRTARAGAAGSVVSLVSRDQRNTVRRMQKALGLDVAIEQPRIEDLRDGGHLVGATPVAANKPRLRDDRPARHGSRPDARTARPVGGQNSSVYVANLPWDAEESDVHGLFGAHGEVIDVAIITDRNTGRSKGFAFVNMESNADAETAVAALHGTDMGGRDLTVRIALPRRTKD